MNTAGAHAGSQDDPTTAQLLITRVLPAPPPVVWQLCTERAHLARWWGPRGFVVAALEMNLMRGGVWCAVVRSSDNEIYLQSGVYRDIVPFERLAFTFVWEHERRAVAREMLCAFTFTDLGTQTKVTFQKGPFTSAQSKDSEREGWSERFDRVAQHLEAQMLDTRSA